MSQPIGKHAFLHHKRKRPKDGEKFLLEQIHAKCYDCMGFYEDLRHVFFIHIPHNSGTRYNSGNHVSSRLAYGRAPLRDPQAPGRESTQPGIFPK